MCVYTCMCVLLSSILYSDKSMTFVWDSALQTNRNLSEIPFEFVIMENLSNTDMHTHLDIHSKFDLNTKATPP